ncbi:TPA: hypothetical protein ACNGYZ_005902, partial [Raoultella planticola]
MEPYDIHIANCQIPDIQLTRHIITKYYAGCFKRGVPAFIKSVSGAAKGYHLPIQRYKWIFPYCLIPVFACSAFPACFGLKYCLCKLRIRLIRHLKRFAFKVASLKIWPT